MTTLIQAYGRRRRVALAALAAGSCAAALTAGGPAHAGAAPASTALARTAAGTITTLAGGTGAPAPGRQAAVAPCGLTVAGTRLYVGNSTHYFADYSRVTTSDVQAISTVTGALTTVAGNGAAQPSDGGGNGALATKLAMTQDCGTAVDAAGNLLVADGTVVQVVAAKTGTFYGQPMTAGHSYVVAGQAGKTRENDNPGDGRRATAALLYDAAGVSVDPAGNLVIADSGLPLDCEDCTAVAGVVRVVAARTGTFYGQPMTAGHIYRVAGSYDPYGTEADGQRAVQASLSSIIGPVRVDAAGNLVIPDYGSGTYYETTPSLVAVVAARTGTFYGQPMTAGHIYRVAGDGQYHASGNGGPAVDAGLATGTDVALDAAGNLVIADYNQVRVVAEQTGTFYGQPMTAGDIYGVAGTTQAGYSGDGGPAPAAEVTASYVAVDGTGNIVLGGGGRIRVVAEQTGTFYGQPMTAADIYTVAGHGRFYSGSATPAAGTQFYSLNGAAADSRGDLLTTDGQHCVIWFAAGRSRRIFGRAVTAGDFYQVGGDGSCRDGSTAGSGIPATQAGFALDATASFDHWGNVVVADDGHGLIRVIAAGTGTFYGQPMTAGDVYTVAGGGPTGCSGSGGPATAASLANPSGVSADRSGNLVVADSSCCLIQVVAAQTGTFYGQPMTAGDIYTIAGDGNPAYSGDGGPALQAGIVPGHAVTDAAGNVVFTDTAGVRVVAEQTGTFYGQPMTAGDIYTIAGGRTPGFSGDGGLAAAAQLGDLTAVTLDSHGDVLVSDEDNDVVWLVAAVTGTRYGRPVTAGHIYVVAGHGTSLGTDGLGDGGQARQARLDLPTGVAVRPDGTLIIADHYDNRLRSVAG